MSACSPSSLQVAYCILGGIGIFSILTFWMVQLHQRSERKRRLKDARRHFSRRCATYSQSMGAAPMAAMQQQYSADSSFGEGLRCRKLGSQPATAEWQSAGDPAGRQLESEQRSVPPSPFKSALPAAAAAAAAADPAAPQRQAASAAAVGGETAAAGGRAFNRSKSIGKLVGWVKPVQLY
jgi:hypothetical protein